MPQQNFFATTDHNFKIDRHLLGNKGANLVDIARLGIPSPAAIIIPTSAWQLYRNRNQELPTEFWEELREELLAHGLLGEDSPKLVSVRSGAAYSMPGMMNTILNVGVNRDNLPELGHKIGEWTAVDSYRRFIEMFSSAALGIHEGIFVSKLAEFVRQTKKQSLSELTVAELRQLIATWEEITQEKIPTDPFVQIQSSVLAVMKSWDSEGARSFREMNGIPDEAGTAVVIQQMVLGNSDQHSGSGVYFTRNPRTGENKPFGEFAVFAQGEDVVGGHFLPRPVEQFADVFGVELFTCLQETGKKLEQHYHRPQDIEFTVEKGKLWILQTRNAKLSGAAAFQVARDLIQENKITDSEAIRIVRPEHINEVLEPVINQHQDKKNRTITGVPASNGVAKGKIALSPIQVKEFAKQETPAVLVIDHIDPNDVDTLALCAGVITTKGGSASHMAIIMRAMSIPGIVGCQAIKFDYHNSRITAGDHVLAEGTEITLDGTTGQIYLDLVEIIPQPELSNQDKELIRLRQEFLGVSPWSAACFRVGKDAQRGTYTKKISDILKKSLWKSPKAKVIELLNVLIPEKEFISSKLFKPDNEQGIIAALTETISAGYENAPRTTHFPQKLAGAQWAYGPNSEADINKFLHGEWPGKYGGLQEWRKDKDLEAVLISQEPVGKLDERYTHEHFTFTVAMLPGKPYKMIISINLGSPQLRAFEKVEQQKLIQVEVAINEDAERYIGATSLRIGRDYLLNPWGDEISVEIPMTKMTGNITTDAQAVITTVTKKVLVDLWQVPVALPHLMSALDDALGISVLEGQGRITDGKVVWCLIYGAKGSEEKARAGMVR